MGKGGGGEAAVMVAVRVRPFNGREKGRGEKAREGRGGKGWEGLVKGEGVGKRGEGEGEEAGG